MATRHIYPIIVKGEFVFWEIQCKMCALLLWLINLYALRSPLQPCRLVVVFHVLAGDPSHYSTSLG